MGVTADGAVVSGTVLGMGGESDVGTNDNDAVVSGVGEVGVNPTEVYRYISFEFTNEHDVTTELLVNQFLIGGVRNFQRQGVDELCETLSADRAPTFRLPSPNRRFHRHNMRLAQSLLAGLHVSVRHSHRQQHFGHQSIVFDTGFAGTRHSRPYAFDSRFQYTRFIFIVLRHCQVINQIVSGSVHFQRVNRRPAPYDDSLRLASPPFGVEIAFTLFRLVAGVLPQRSRLFRITRSLRGSIGSRR